ncbi:MAG: hypothetical protein Q4C49_10240 [Bacillota bacterium]|nr:hypothetical protein [Bacillota bacterium]
MIAGIQSFQGRINELSKNISSVTSSINDRLDQFDKINDLLINEMKKIQIKDVYGLIEEKEFNHILNKEISMLICTYFLLDLEEKPNKYQYEFFKGCCVKLNNFSIAEYSEQSMVLEELAEMCDVAQAEIVVKLVSLFLSLGSLESCLDFLSSDLLDDFYISNSKISKIEKYVTSMNEIYGKKLCFLYGKISDSSFTELSNEIEIKDPVEMFRYGEKLIQENRNGLRWIVKSASKGYKNAISYLENNFYNGSKVVGCSEDNVYYLKKDVYLKLFVATGIGDYYCILDFKRIAAPYELVDSPIYSNGHIAFAIVEHGTSYLFVINTYKNQCTLLDSWNIEANQSPTLQLDKGKIRYGVMDFDIFRIRSDETITDYRINFDGTGKESVYR